MFLFFVRSSLAVLALVSLQAFPLMAQNVASSGPWQRLQRIPQDRPAATVWSRPRAFQAFALNHGVLGELLGRAPHENAQRASTSPVIIELPMPDGALARFRFVESPIMEPALAAKFPEIKTYLGQGIDDPLATVRFDLTPAGFHAQILSPNGAVYIDPYWHGYNDVHISYYKHDYHRLTNDFQCLTATPEVQSLSTEFQPMTLSGGILRNYRLACAATGEYVQFHGGTVSAGMAAIVTAINRVTGVYETEVSIRLVLVANNDQIVYTNPNTDPYNNSSGSTMLNQNQSNLDAVIGSGNYDIGHVS